MNLLSNFIIDGRDCRSGRDQTSEEGLDGVDYPQHQSIMRIDMFRVFYPSSKLLCQWFYFDRAEKFGLTKNIHIFQPIVISGLIF